MSIEEKDKEKDKSIYNYNMIFNKIGNNNSEEDNKFNTDLISDLDLQNFDPRRYEYYTNLLKIYNEDPDTLFNLLNKYNSIKYTKEDEKKLIRQIYDYAVKYAKAKKADDDWKKGTPTIATEQGGGGAPGAAGAPVGKEAAEAPGDGAGAAGDGTGAPGASGKFKKAGKDVITSNKVVDAFKNNAETAKLTPIELLIKGLSDKLNNVLPNPNEDEATSAKYTDTFVNDYNDEKKSPEEKLKEIEKKNVDKLKNTYKENDTIKLSPKKEATPPPPPAPGDPPPPAPGNPPGNPTGNPTGVPTRGPTGQEQQPEEDKLLMGAIVLDLIGNLPVSEQSPPAPAPPPAPPPAPTPAAAENKILDSAFNLLPGLLKNIDEDELLKQALELSQKILNNINKIEIKEQGKRTILDDAVDLLPTLLHKEPAEPAEESTLLNSSFGLLPTLLNIKADAAPAPAPAEESTLLNSSFELLPKLLNINAEAPPVPPAPPPVPPAPAEDKEILDNTLDLSKKLLVPGAAQEGGKKKIKGGAIDKYSDDILKMQYLNTKRYNNVKKADIEDYRKEQKIRKYNIVPTETSNKIEQLSNDIDVYNDKIEKNNDDDKYIIQKIKIFENDPKNPIEELALTFDDRIVFIIATFFIRYITIIMVQWCIDINIIKTFYEGFIYYAVIYILIFWFIVLFVNIDNTYDVKYMNFNGVINSIRTLFYYFYMGTNGISRLLIHTSLIIILIIIPIILNIKGKVEFKDEDQSEAVVILAYEERKQLSKSLSLFTMFIWLFTSIIATKF